MTTKLFKTDQTAPSFWQSCLLARQKQEQTRRVLMFLPRKYRSSIGSINECMSLSLLTAIEQASFDKSKIYIRTDHHPDPGCQRGLDEGADALAKEPTLHSFTEVRNKSRRRPLGLVVKKEMYMQMHPCHTMSPSHPPLPSSPRQTCSNDSAQDVSRGSLGIVPVV